MKSDKELFVSRLLRACRQFAGCSIQHKGCPCNKCFHTFAEDTLGLTPELAHNFWQIVLVLRGDYTPEQVKKFEEAYEERVRGN